MTTITATVTFELRDENGLHDLSDDQLATELKDLIEDEYVGIGEFTSVKIGSFEVRRS